MSFDARFSSHELTQATGGVWTSPPPTFETPVRVWTDTRTLVQGDFFLPLKGANFDGHDYLDTAFANGVVGAFVSVAWLDKNPAFQKHPSLLVVPDPLEAYLNLARFHRRRCAAKVIAVTGSSGKTTVKELLFAALSPLLLTQCSAKNFNNEVGVSQTLLSLQPDTKLLIVEMGMRGLGQISVLTHAAEPDLALVTNVGPAHLGQLGSLENVAQAKCEIFEGLTTNTGIGLVNGDDPLLLETARRVWGGRLEMFRLADAGDWGYAPHGGMQFTYQGTQFHLQGLGPHHVANALAVLKAGECLGFSPQQLQPGLETFTPPEGRGQRLAISGAEEGWVIDDAYNANPSSMRASLQAFLEAPQSKRTRRVLVLGGMQELGDQSQRYHEALGAWLAGQKNLTLLAGVDEAGSWITAAAKAHGADFPVLSGLSVESTLRELLQTFPDWHHTQVLVKGSRASGLEQIVHGLTTPTPAASLGRGGG